MVQTGHPATSAAVSNDGSLLVTGGDNSIVLWHLASGLELRRVVAPERLNQVLIAPDRSAIVGVAALGLGPAWQWDPATGAPLPAFGTGDVIRAAYSRDGRFLVTADKDSTATVWEVATQRRLGCVGHSRSRKGMIEGPPVPLTACAVDPEGAKVLIGEWNGSVQLWNVTTGEGLWSTAPPATFRDFARDGVRNLIDFVGFLPAGLVIVASASAALAVRNATTGAIRATLPGSEGIGAVAVSPDGTRLAGASGTGLRLWNLEDHSHEDLEAPLAPARPGKEVPWLPAFLSDGRILAVGLSKHPVVIRVWEPGSASREIAKHGWLRATAASADLGTLVVSGDSPGGGPGWATHAIPLATGGPSIPLGAGAVMGVSADGRYAFTSDEATVHAWHLETGARVGEVPLSCPPGYEVSEAFVAALRVHCPAGGAIVLARMPDSVHLFRPLEPAPFARVALAPAEVPLALSDDGGRLGTASPFGRDNMDLTGFALRDTAADRVVWEYRPEAIETDDEAGSFDPRVRAAAFSPDGARVAVGTSDSTVRIFDAADGRLVHVLGTVPRPTAELWWYRRDVTAVRFSADARALVAGRENGTATIWDARTGTELRELGDLESAKGAPHLSADARFCLTRGPQRTLRLWDVASGQELGRIAVARDGRATVFDRAGRFDTDDLERAQGLHWVMPDDPFTPLPPGRFAHDFHRPRFYSRLLAGEASRPAPD